MCPAQLSIMSLAGTKEYSNIIVSCEVTRILYVKTNFKILQKGNLCVKTIVSILNLKM